jgi:hypothetical protein
MSWASWPNRSNVKVGEIVQITRHAERGWGEGILNGTLGRFPADHVDVLSARAAAATSFCKVIYDYTAHGPDELTLTVLYCTLPHGPLCISTLRPQL